MSATFVRVTFPADAQASTMCGDVCNGGRVTKFIVDTLHAAGFVRLMDSFHSDPNGRPTKYYLGTVEPSVAMLGEVEGEDTFVFVLPNTMFKFASTPANYADKLLQRAQAAEFFDQIVAASSGTHSIPRGLGASPRKLSVVP